MPTTLDILKIDELHPLLSEADEFVNTFPELNFFESSPVKNITFNGLTVDVADGQSGFREPNKSRPFVYPTLAQKIIQLKFLDASWSIDYATALADYRGRDHAIQMVARTALASAFQNLTKQIWQGTKANAEGFQGFDDLINADTPKVGTSAAGAEKIYFVNSSPETAQLCYGENGNVYQSPIYDSMITTSGNSGYGGWSQKIGTWVGLQLLSKYSFGIAYAAADVSKLTDDIFFELISAFPVGFAPAVSPGRTGQTSDGRSSRGAFFCSRNAIKILRQSRTATNVTGAPAPYPAEVGGIPIYATEAIVPVPSA